MKKAIEYLKEFQYPQEALNIIAKLQMNGFDTYFVGGCIRDILFKNEPKDFDIVTEATPEQVKEIFENSCSVGEQFLVSLVNGYEIATTRNESNYDGRKPSSVKPATFYEDANRRDLTINAIYYDPINYRVFDPHDGITDAYTKTARFIGKTEDRVKEDHLRILRALRISSDNNLNDFRMLTELTELNEYTMKVSEERVINELKKVENKKSFFRSLFFIHKFYMDEQIENIIENSKDLMLSLAIIFFFYEDQCCYIFESSMKRFVNSIVRENKLKDDFWYYFEKLKRFKCDFELVSDIKNMYEVRKEMSDDRFFLFLDSIVDYLDYHSGFYHKAYRQMNLMYLYDELYPNKAMPETIADGEFIQKQFNLKPSKLVGELKNHLYELQLNDIIKDEEDALYFGMKYMKGLII